MSLFKPLLLSRFARLVREPYHPMPGASARLFLQQRDPVFRKIGQRPIPNLPVDAPGRPFLPSLRRDPSQDYRDADLRMHRQPRCHPKPFRSPTAPGGIGFHHHEDLLFDAHSCRMKGSAAPSCGIASPPGQAPGKEEKALFPLFRSEGPRPPAFPSRRTIRH